MKNHVKRITSSLLCICLMLALLPFHASALNASIELEADIGRGLSLNHLRRQSSDGSSRQIFTLDYTPGQGVRPLVGYGGKLYGMSDINYVINYIEQQGYTVLAAVNADFFNMDTGVPTGMLINNGRLCVSDGAWNAVAFFADGTAMAGTPQLNMTYYRPATGLTYSIYALNKVRTAAGVYLYSDDFAATTKTTLNGTEVVLECMSGDFLRLGQPLELRVVAISPTPGTAIGINQFVLSLSDANIAGLSLADIQVGESIIINASTSNPRWHDAVYSCGGGNMLARGGVLTAEATGSADARTVLGVRPDGSVSILVCDGRQKGLSDGISLAEAATMLLNDGCISVVNLDGGGSTAISARDAGKASSVVKSSPSDGSPRKCANFIVFVADGDASQPETAICVYPRQPAVLAGASLELTAYAYNDNYFPKGQVASGFYVSGGEGEMDGNVYHSPVYGGYATVGIYAGWLDVAEATVRIVDNPDSISFVKAGTVSPLTTLAVNMDSVTALEMYATFGLQRLTSQNSQFEFEVIGGVGTIDRQGVFTAASTPGLTGAITATWNGITIALPVTVGRAPVVLESFEGQPAYTVMLPTPAEGEAPTTATGTAALSNAPENARYGVGSLMLSYSAAKPEDIIRFTAGTAYPLTGGSNIVSLLARGSGDFGVDFMTPNGYVRVPITLLGNGWQYITVEVPAGATSVAGFSASGTGALSGSVIIDQLMAHYGSAANDITPPVIDAIFCDGISFVAQIGDNYALPITGQMITLTLDGVSIPFDYDPATGIVSTQLGEVAAGTHRITIRVEDYFQNAARQSVIFGELDTAVFQDLDDHWAQSYAEYLRQGGVFSDSEKFNPQQTITNEMAATVISRFLGTDTTRYDGLEMPYADGAKISDWAAPHVKAMYYEGIMIGGIDAAGNRVFSPQAASTRAQVMTILGRTLPRGYSYEQAPFEDYGAIPGWAADHIDLLYSMGIVSGYTGTANVNPLATITRAEVASLLFKLY